jgi:hypothetical protein
LSQIYLLDLSNVDQKIIYKQSINNLQTTNHKKKLI